MNQIIKNESIESENYEVTISNAGSSLVASFIKKGVTIGGITGTLEVVQQCKFRSNCKEYETRRCRS